MNWQARLLEIAVAGGLSATGCGDESQYPDYLACNANPDPCCMYPNGEECLNKADASDATPGKADASDATPDAAEVGDESMILLPTCDANVDPCCLDPDGSACVANKQDK
jgi:hypothetical protein